VEAGPYGLSAAETQRADEGGAGFGKPMEFWARDAAGKMLLRRRRVAANILGGRAATKLSFIRARGQVLPSAGDGSSIDTVSIREMVSARGVPDMDGEMIATVDPSRRNVSITLDDGAVIRSDAWSWRRASPVKRPVRRNSG